MIVRLTWAFAGALTLACGGAPPAEKRTISDPVPNVSLTERESGVEPEVIPPGAAPKTGGISDPIQPGPMTETTPPPGEGAPPSTAQLGGADSTATPCAADDDNCRIERLGDVRLGWLREGMPRADVIAKLGEPAEVEKPWEEGATGEWVSENRWPKAGVSILFSANSEGGSQTARGITVRAPFAEKTDRGVGIGSSEAEVRAAYAGTFDPRPSGLVAGSVYGGVFFDFDDAGRVVSIFIGPGAE